jgi:hypothetical protein
MVAGERRLSKFHQSLTARRHLRRGRFAFNTPPPPSFARQSQITVLQGCCICVLLHATLLVSRGPSKNEKQISCFANVEVKLLKEQGVRKTLGGGGWAFCPTQHAHTHTLTLTRGGTDGTDGLIRAEGGGRGRAKGRETRERNTHTHRFSCSERERAKRRERASAAGATKKKGGSASFRLFLLLWAWRGGRQGRMCGGVGGSGIAFLCQNKASFCSPLSPARQLSSLARPPGRALREGMCACVIFIMFIY